MAVLVYYLVQNSTSFSILSVKNVKENCIPEPFYIRKMGHSGYFPGSKYRWQCFFVLLLFFPFLINQCGIGGFGPPTSKERVRANYYRTCFSFCRMFYSAGASAYYPHSAYAPAGCDVG